MFTRIIKTFSITALLTTLLLLNASCSNKTKTKSQFKFSAGYLALTIPYDGGIFMLRKNTTTGEVINSQIQQDQIVEIPSANYDLMFVVFTGPSIKSGTKYCSFMPNTKIEGADTTLNVTITTSTCSDANLQAFISELTGGGAGGNQWDVATWDQGTWGP